MKREQLFTQLRAVTQSVAGLFALCPQDRLLFLPKGATRTLLDLANHFAALPLVDLATLQASRRQVVETIEETLHGAGPEDWTDIFVRGAKAVEEYFERMTDEEFETKTSRAHYGTSKTQAGWLLETICHIYHHRGQLYVYLKMLGVPVDVEHLYT